MKQELGPLIEDRRQHRERVSLLSPSSKIKLNPVGAQRKWPEEKLPIELDSLRNFNLRAKIVGPQVCLPFRLVWVCSD